MARGLGFRGGEAGGLEDLEKQKSVVEVEVGAGGTRGAVGRVVLVFLSNL